MAPVIDWNKRPYVTGMELMEMAPHQRAWFENQPNIWRPLQFHTDVLYNCAHPDNADLVAQDLLREVLHG